MELAAEKPWVLIARQLNYLDELAVGRDAAEDQPALLQRLSIGGIKFVSMTMALADGSSAVVNVPGQRACREAANPRAQAHCASHFFDLHQIAQFENDWIRRLDIEFRRVGVF